MPKSYLSLDDLKYKRENIFFINDPMMLKAVFEELQSAKVLGLDSEWNTYTSLFQISTTEKTFIIDFLKPNDKNPENFNEKLLNLMVEHFLCDIFDNPDIIKVSWDFFNDIVKLYDRFPKIAKKKVACLNSLVDLLDYKTSMIPNGFSAFCKHHLGKELNKEHQCSDWEVRPLSDSQFEYAALDSIVAVRLYEKLSANLNPKTHDYSNRIKGASGVNPKKLLKELMKQQISKVEKPNEKK
jgi:ribonuclease D